MTAVAPMFIIPHKSRSIKVEGKKAPSSNRKDHNRRVNTIHSDGERQTKQNEPQQRHPDIKNFLLSMMPQHRETMGYILFVVHSIVSAAGTRPSPKEMRSRRLESSSSPSK